MKVFLLAALAGLVLVSQVRGADPNVTPRGDLNNSWRQFQKRKTGHVAFLGGSITEMDGYRPMVCELLQKRFPETNFTFTAAGVSSTCSTTGAFRLQNDVLSKGPVDLLFVEYAVNDDQDAAHTREECIRGMEGIIRHLRRTYPKADVVMTFFLNENSMRKYNAGETPLPVAAHTEVAERYHVSTINLAKAVTSRISAGEFDWKKFGGVHPAPFGNRIAADMIAELFAVQWATPPKGASQEHPLPEPPLDAKSYSKGRFVNFSELKLDEPWKVRVPDWKSLSGGKRPRFSAEALLDADQVGAEMTFPFEGTAVGAYVLAGPDAGMLEVSVDGGELRKVNLFHDHSRGLHYPRTVMFADTLSEGAHVVKLKISDEKDQRSSGHAFRALRFVVNDGK
jgi:lysophospholipase L1-like esterase